MKIRSAVICTLFILFLSSCNQKTSGTIVNQSPDKNVTITITAKRPTVVDAWNVTLTVKAYSFKEDKRVFEVYDNDLNDSNIKFDWSDNNNCLITIPQREDKPRHFQLIANHESVQLSEI